MSTIDKTPFIIDDLKVNDVVLLQQRGKLFVICSIKDMDGINTGFKEVVVNAYDSGQQYSWSFRPQLSLNHYGLKFEHGITRK